MGSSEDMGKSVTGKIESISPVVLGGNTHYYICLENKEDIYDIDMSDTDLIQIIRYQAGDTITIEYLEGYGLHEVRGIK